MSRSKICIHNTVFSHTRVYLCKIYSLSLSLCTSASSRWLPCCCMCRMVRLASVTPRACPKARGRPEEASCVAREAALLRRCSRQPYMSVVSQKLDAIQTTDFVYYSRCHTEGVTLYMIVLGYICGCTTAAHTMTTSAHEFQTCGGHGRQSHFMRPCMFHA